MLPKTLVKISNKKIEHVDPVVPSIQPFPLAVEKGL